MTRENLNEVWNRILKGKTVNDCHVLDGRINLMNLDVRKSSKPEGWGLFAKKINELKEINLRSLDLTGSKLKGLIFIECTIHNCIFDQAECQDWKMWATTVEDCTFKNADLRRSSLGGMYNNQPNFFHRVVFYHADLRSCVFEAARFSDCKFINCKLDKIDFQSSVFENCVFEGELNEVIFYKRSYAVKNLPVNPMKNIDFSRAQLYLTEFRGLDMDSVTMPRDDDHLVVHDYKTKLANIKNKFRDQDDAVVLSAYIENLLKWAGENQQQGVINKKELRDVLGEKWFKAILPLLG